MKAVVIRTGSISAHSPAVSGSISAQSPVVSRTDSLSGARSTVGSPRISLNLDANRRKNKMIRRAMSESDILRSEPDYPAKSRGFPARLARIWSESGIPVEELGDRGVNTLAVDRGEQKKIGAYYEKMLKSNPGDPLLLRNHGKFLHEVEKDAVRAEEYYCRAILASPGDGEVLSLYGKLIWENQRDGERAKSYFDQAVSASPDDCMVLGSFASFMWEADKNEDDDEEIDINNTQVVSSAPVLVPAF